MLDVLIDEFINYLEKVKRYSPHTLIAYSNDLHQFKTYLAEAYEVEKVVEIKSTFLRSFIVKLATQELDNRSINRKISSIKSFTKHLLRNEYIEIDFTEKITAPKVKKILPSFVKEERILDDLEDLVLPDTFENNRNKLIFSIFYNTGIRRAELINLKESDIDQVSKRFKVLGKGKKERFIPVSNGMLQECNKYIERKEAEFMKLENNYLFVTRRGKKLYPKAVYIIINKLLSTLTTLEKKGPHVLRHSFATHLLNQGADINAIKELLGHANLSATQVYTHNSIEKIKSIYHEAHPKG